MDVTASDKGLDLRGYLRILRRRWRLVLVCLLTAISAALVVTVSATPTYTAHATLFVSAQEGSGANISNAYTGGLFTQQRVKSFQASASGVVTAAVKIPSNATPGVHHINISGIAPDGSTRILSTRIVIAGAATGNGLPFTGAEIGIASGLGVTLLAAGAVAVLAGRRRKVSVVTA